MYDFIKLEDYQKLLDNDRRQAGVKGTGKEIDFVPVVLLYVPHTQMRWLLTEVSNEDPSIAFGLADMGMMCPELGSISLAEMAELDPGIAEIKPCQCFTTDKPLSWWADEARKFASLAAVRQPRTK